MPGSERGALGGGVGVGCLLVLGWAAVLFGAPRVQAHHGGLGIEGDLVQWALKIDQWQAEAIDQGYRIKFLAYPRQPLPGNRTRLVFEIQAVASGRYVSGLAAQLRLQAPDGTQQTLPLPETVGVTAYYEATVVFQQAGEHLITFAAQAAGVPFTGIFRQGVSRHPLLGDWPTVVGNLAVLAAFAVTWGGLVLSIQRRFMPPRPP